MTDLPALRLLAWQNPALDPCETCHQTPGHRCRTTGNKVTTPHAPRLLLARGWDARQGEVDGLGAQVDAVRATNEALNEAVADLEHEGAAFINERDQARTRADNLAAALEASDAARVIDRDVAARLVADLRARVAELTELSKSQAADLELAAETQAELEGRLTNLTTALETAEEAREDALQDAADVRRELAECQAAHEPEPALEARFAGDPGEGNYLVGWALERGTASGWDLAEAMAQPWWNPKISLIHDYARTSAKLVDRTSITEIKDAGFAVASQSMKMTALAASDTARFDLILSGGADAVIDADADWCKAQPIAIHLCVIHEPEHITSALQAKFRAASRYVALRFRGRGATNVTFQPIYMTPYTFRTGSDWRVWHPDWSGTAWQTDLSMGLFGMDVYNPLPPSSGNTGKNRVFSEMVGVVTIDKVRASGLPEVPRTMPEFGMGRIDTADQKPPGGWLAWATDAVAYAKANSIVTFTYWDNSDDIGRYRVTDPDKRAAWDYICTHAAASV